MLPKTFYFKEAKKSQKLFKHKNSIQTWTGRTAKLKT
jgi:hypothetical protein